MESSRWAETFELELKPLWLDALDGDSQSYEMALTLIAKRLRGYFARRLQAMPAEVEDLVQETLMAIHLKRATYDSSYSVTGWALAIGKYKLFDFWRRHERTTRLHDDLDDVDVNELVAQQPEPGTPHDLDVLLHKLPPAQRTAIELTKLHGMTAAQAAQISGMSISAIKVNVHRGMKRLSDLMKSSP